MKAESGVDPVYFLYGPEKYLIDEELERLLNQTLSSKERGLNLHVFHGEEHGGREIVSAAQTVPMFSRYRFVLVNEADAMDEEKIETLLEYIRKPSPTTCLVMQGQALGLWKRHRHDIEKVGKVIECLRLKGRALVSWVRKRMAEKGKTLSEDAADYLVEVVGDHLHDLENTLERVFLSAGQKGAIGLTDVEAVAADVKVSTVFDLTDAIGHQNLEKALGILEKALESKAIPFRKDEEVSRMNDPIPLLLSMMAKQFRNLWRVKEASSRLRAPAEVAKAMKMSPWQVKKLMEQMKNFSEASLREGILKCHQTDLSVKKRRGPKDLLMEKLVIDLCRPVQEKK